MFNIEYVKDLKWENEDHSFFSCTVKYAEFAEELPSGVNGTDPLPHIREMWDKANAGHYGPIAEYVYIELPIPDIVPGQQPTVIGAQTL